MLLRTEAFKVRIRACVHVESGSDSESLEALCQRRLLIRDINCYVVYQGFGLVAVGGGFVVKPYGASNEAGST